MKQLDRYILREFLAPLALVVLGLSGLMLLVQVVDTLPHLREWHATAGQILAYHLFQLPFLATQVLPIGVMLATLVALGGLARTSELSAMGAGGISRWRIALPLLGVSLALSLGLLAVSETVVPQVTAWSRYIQKVQIEKRDVDFDMSWRDHMVKNLGQGRQLYARHFDARTGIMDGGLTMIRVENGVLRERWDAQSAEWKGDQWKGSKVWQLRKGIWRDFDEKGRERHARLFNDLVLDLGAKPRDLMVDSDKREQDLLQLSYAELSRIIERLQVSGSDDRKEKVCRQLRLSYPFSCLILALLGVSLPYLFPTGRRALTGAALGLLISLGCGITYLVFIQVGISLGKSGKLPILLSAWLGNLVFGGAGTWVLWKVNK